MGKQQSEKHVFASKTVNNKRYMICRNSEADGKYWQGKLCDEWSKVGMNTTSVLCHKCSARIAGDPEVGQLLQQIVFVRGNINKATLKKDIKANKTQLRKLERQVNKLK